MLTYPCSAKVSPKKAERTWSRVQRQTWDGSEPALQLLILPAQASNGLPVYSPRPEPLHPVHCRLCLASPPASEPDPDSWLTQHLLTCHEMTPDAYRAYVLPRVLTEWPQKIPAQLLRARVTSYKAALCDAQYAVAACASCAREKRRCKLHLVEFPPPTTEVAPDWLGVQTEDWLQQ